MTINGALQRNRRRFLAITRRPKFWPLLVSGTLLVCGVVDVALIAGYLGIGPGLVEAFNDPGKTFMHVVLLPIAGYAYARGFPRELIAPARPNFREDIWIALAASAVIASTTFTSLDANKSFCSDTALPSPADFDSATTRNTLVGLHDGARRAIRNAINDTSDRNLEGVNSDLLSLHNFARRCVEKYCRDFKERTSFRHLWSNLLTVLAVVFAGFIVIEVVAHVVRQERMRERYKNLLLVLCMFMLWFPLRVYSDWYLNFGHDYLLRVAGLMSVAASLGICVLSLIWILHLSNWRVERILMTLLVSASALVSVLVAVKPKIVALIATLVAAIAPSYVVGIFIVMGVTLLMIVRILLGSSAQT